MRKPSPNSCEEIKEPFILKDTYIFFILLSGGFRGNTYSLTNSLMGPVLINLMFVLGDLFRKEVDEYMRRGFHKGIPPLFVDLKSLYQDKEKVRIIEDLLQSYLVALKTTGCFSLERKF